MQQRTAYIVSDRTGLTAEAMTHSLLSQFPTIDFNVETIPFVDSISKATDLVARFNTETEEAGAPPLVFVTLVDDQVRARILNSRAIVFDLFNTFIEPMEKELRVESSHSIGKSHGVSDMAAYTARISAVHFALATDDGMDTGHYGQSEVILIGVSRCGKTPTCLYLALQFGMFASNYPLTESELRSGTLPKVLEPYKNKIFALTIDPFRLLAIRKERYSGESYSSVNACQTEVGQAENIFRSAGLPIVNTSRMSIEEIGATIMHKGRFRRTGA